MRRLRPVPIASLLLLAGCGQAVPPAPAPPAAGSAHAGLIQPEAANVSRAARVRSADRWDGTWVAVGHVLRVRGGGLLYAGERIKRAWVFHRSCSPAGCGVEWVRIIDVGVLRAMLEGRGTQFHARFVQREPCTDAANPNVAKAIGAVASDWRVTRRGRGRITADEHQYALTAACGAVDHVIRWTARRVSRRDLVHVT